MFTVQSNTSQENEMKQRVLEVAEDYGLNVEEKLDDVAVKYLGTYVKARTSKDGRKVRIEFDSVNFFQQSEEEQRRTILHELIHLKQFDNSLSDWAEKEFNVSEDFAEKLDGTIWEDVKSVEGETELILSSFFPEENSSYPYAQKTKENEFESIGLNVESEITQKIEEETDEILDEYREIGDIDVEENIYMEEGTIDGVNYSVAYMGENAADEGPQRVEEYLKGEIEEAIEYDISPEPKPSIRYKPA